MRAEAAPSSAVPPEPDENPQIEDGASVNRRQAREQILQVLHMLDVSGLQAVEALRLFITCHLGGRPMDPFVREVVSGISENGTVVDQTIREHSENWRLNRMPIVDRNLLRLAVFELLFREDIPPKVSINEAIELGKKYGSEESGAFINGILDGVYRKLKREATYKSGTESEGPSK